MNRAIEKVEALKGDSEAKQKKAEADAHYFKGSVDTCAALLDEFKKLELVEAPPIKQSEAVNGKDNKVKNISPEAKKSFIP